MGSNLHRTFRAKLDGFINEIKPTSEQRDYLNECRQKVRAVLKHGMANFIAENGGDPNTIKPKFRLQGSWAYGTCNQPAYPSQEMDVDYGVYLPNSLLAQGRSDIVAKSYFVVVEALLEPLASREGWTLCKTKNTCCRLILAGNAHMDVPLYIVPDLMFESLVERNNMILDEAKATIAKDEYIFKGYQYFEDRDDLALLHVVKKLPEILLGPVKEDSIPEHTDEDFNRIPVDERSEAHDLASELLDVVTAAIEVESAKTSINFLRSKFGKRIPDNESYVIIENTNQELPLQTVSPATIQPTRGG